KRRRNRTRPCRRRAWSTSSSPPPRPPVTGKTARRRCTPSWRNWRRCTESRAALDFLLAVGHLRLETCEDAAVHLADARLGEVQGGADLLHRHLLEVVEDDDQPLGAGKSLGDQFLQVLALDLAHRVGPALVLQHV